MVSKLDRTNPMATNTLTNSGMKVALSKFSRPAQVAMALIKTSPMDLAAVPASVAKNPELKIPLAQAFGITLDSNDMLGPSRQLADKKTKMANAMYW